MMETAERDFIVDVIKRNLKPIVKEVITESLAEAFEDMLKKNRKQYYTRDEVCQRLKIGTSTFYRLANVGKIKILKLEGRTLVDADEFDMAVHERKIWRYQHDYPRNSK